MFVAVPEAADRLTVYRHDHDERCDGRSREECVLELGKSLLQTALTANFCFTTEDGDTVFITDPTGDSGHSMTSYVRWLYENKLSPLLKVGPGEQTYAIHDLDKPAVNVVSAW